MVPSCSIVDGVVAEKSQNRRLVFAALHLQRKHVNGKNQLSANTMSAPKTKN